MNLCFWSPKHQVAAIRGNIKRHSESCELDLGCVVELVLNGRKVHGYVSAIGEAEWFYDMRATQGGTKRSGQGGSLFGD